MINSLKMWGLFLMLLLVTVACGTSNSIEPSPTPPPVEETESPVATDTIPTTTSLPAELPPTETPLVRPTLAPTPTGGVILPTPTLAPTSTSPPTSGDFPPLTFVWEISWELAEDNPGIAIATLTIIAAGGNGQYSYFSDDILQDGPIFSYEWASCRARPGSVRVDSGDGQTVREDYFEQPPCPTVTPTP